MSGGDHNRGRTTKRFDKAQLAELARKAQEDRRPAPPATTSPPAPPRDLPRGTEGLAPLSRTATVQDPLTTQLLAEVARRAQTIDMDEELIDKLTERLSEGETNHPHTRKRKT